MCTEEGRLRTIGVALSFKVRNSRSWSKLEPAAGGCSAKDPTAPMSQTKNLSVIAAGRDANNDGEESPRAGTFHAEKNCGQYSGLAGGFCTITVATLKQIPVGTKVVYTGAATATAVITDVTLVPPSPGNNVAFGHVVLSRVTRTGNASSRAARGSSNTSPRVSSSPT